MRIKKKKILKNKLIGYTIEESFNEINNDKKIKFINEIGLNPVEILLGIKIPGIKQIIENIIIYIHDKQNDDLNLAEKLYGNENELRNFESEDENEEAKRKLVKNIEKNIEKNQLNLFHYLKSIPLFKKIDFALVNNCKKEEAIDYFNMLYDDYLLIFLSNNFDLSLRDEYNIELIENLKNLIKKLVEQRFGDYNKDIKIDELLKKISRQILWIESNSKYIVLTLLIYKKLSFIQLLNEKMNKIIEKKEIKYECGTNRSPVESKKVNECFFLYNESMIKVILMENNLYEKIGDNLLGFINTIKEIYHYASQLNYELNLFSKELSNIKCFIDIEKIFNEMGEHKEENIKQLINILVEKNKYNQVNEESKEKEISNKILDIIKKLYGVLINIIGKHKNFSKLFNEILYGEYIRVTDENFRKSILELILHDEIILKDSTRIFLIFFYDVVGNKSLDDIEHGEKVINQFNMYFELIESALNEKSNIKIKLEQLLLNIFESYFLVFFEDIPNLGDDELKIHFKQFYESKKSSEELVMLDFSLDIFKNKILLLERIFNQNILSKHS